MKYFYTKSFFLLFTLILHSAFICGQKSRTQFNSPEYKEHELSINAYHCVRGLYGLQYEYLLKKQNLSLGFSAERTFNNYAFQNKRYNLTTKAEEFNYGYVVHYGFSFFSKFYFNKKAGQGFYIRLLGAVYNYTLDYYSSFHDAIRSRDTKHVDPGLGFGFKVFILSHFTFDISGAATYRKRKTIKEFTGGIPILACNLGYRF